MIKKFFDPNQTVRHVPYKEIRARLKREQEWSEKFVRVLALFSLAGVLILGFVYYVASHW